MCNAVLVVSLSNRAGCQCINGNDTNQTPGGGIIVIDDLGCSI
jgi:hypothetical protein